MSEVTVGRPAAIASSTTSPQPSVTDGNVNASAAWYQAGNSASGTVPSSTSPSPVSPSSSALARQRSRYCRWSWNECPPTTASRGAGSTAVRAFASASTRCRLPFRGSSPPTVRNTKPSSRPARARRAAGEAAPGLPNLAVSTPFGTMSERTPNSLSSSRCQCRLTTSTWSGSVIDCS